LPDGIVPSITRFTIANGGIRIATCTIDHPVTSKSTARHHGIPNVAIYAVAFEIVGVGND